jgi:myo-inositol-1-phosphate synthase
MSANRTSRQARAVSSGNALRIAIIGVGNCASSLVQGASFYRGASAETAVGLMHWEIGGYRPGDLEVAAAFDVDLRKVGKDVAEAIFEKPNCTAVFCDRVPKTGVRVHMGPVLDGISDHFGGYPEERRFVVSDQKEASREEVVALLRDARVDVLVNYLPVGAERAARFYAECALEARIAVVNCIPVFLASDPEFAARFSAAGVPILGDDIKAQLGATITHRALVDLFAKRGVEIDRTYQLNTGGNTDFLNMLNRSRLASKKISKTEAVQAVARERIADENIHVGPSDYVPWQNDNKVCFLRIEGRLFGNVPMNLELRLSVEDSPNSAGVAIDAIRCAKLAADRGLGGPIEAPSAFFMKHPPRQWNDDEAHRLTEAFVRGERSPG